MNFMTSSLHSIIKERYDQLLNLKNKRLDILGQGGVLNIINNLREGTFINK